MENANEKLVSPVNDKRKDRGTGYKSLADNLPKFAEVGQLPIRVTLSHLDEGRGIEETLRFHKKHHGTNHVSINAAVQS